MTDFIQSMNPGVIWTIAGIILLLLEFAMPGFILFFFGAGALIVGILCFIIPISLNIQLLLFSIISLFTFFMLRKKMQTIFMGRVNKGKTLDDDMDDFSGQKAVVTEKITPKHTGKVEFHGTTWNADSEETIQKDQTIEITGKSNLTLTVKSV